MHLTARRSATHPGSPRVTPTGGRLEADPIRPRRARCRAVQGPCHALRSLSGPLGSSPPLDTGRTGLRATRPQRRLQEVAIRQLAP
jgi:hypothetical protein